MHFRNPHELGGLYFTFTLCLSPVTCLYFGSRYLAFIEDPMNASKLTFVLSRDKVNLIIFGIIALQITTLLFFLKVRACESLAWRRRCRSHHRFQCLFRSSLLRRS